MAHHHYHHHPYRQGTTLLHETKKQKLLSMSRTVYSDATECEIKLDTIQFGNQMLEYRNKIRNKRKRIGELLGLPLVGVDGYDDVDEELMEIIAAGAPSNKEEGGAASSESLAMKNKIHNAESTATTTTPMTASNNKDKVDYALGESILLLRNDTIKLETTVSHLRTQIAEIYHCTNNKTQDTPGTSIIDIVNDNTLNNDVIFTRMRKLPYGKEGELRLASRFIQDDVDEIVICEYY